MSELSMFTANAKYQFQDLEAKLGEDEFKQLVALIERMVEAGKKDLWKEAERAFTIR